MVQFKQVNLLLVVQPQGEHPDADAHDDGHQGNEEGQNVTKFRHINFLVE